MLQVRHLSRSHLPNLNDDGTLDLIVTNLGSAITNFGDRNVSLLGGLGDGNFDAPINYEIQSRSGFPRSAAVADLNGDGALDLAIANTTDLRLLLNHGNGTFPGAANYRILLQGVSTAAADLNGDGSFDLAVANFDNRVSVLWNKTGFPLP